MLSNSKGSLYKTASENQTVSTHICGGPATVRGHLERLQTPGTERNQDAPCTHKRQGQSDVLTHSYKTERLSN